MLNAASDVSPEFCRIRSSLKIRSLTPSSVRLVVPVELLTIVTIPCQLSGKEDNKNNVKISSANLIFTNFMREIIDLYSLM